jgi:hypothetical protein
MNVEILTFEGCPNAEAARELAQRIVAELRPDAAVEHVDVADPAAAERLRFLGSPTIRVNGVDIEPGAGERTEYVYACRIYRTERGAEGIPDERWLRDALRRDA